MQRCGSLLGGEPCDSYDEYGLGVRCIVHGGGFPDAMIPAVYNANMRIAQTPGYVAITYELIHDTRIIPIETPALRDQIINDVIPAFLNDRVKARELQPDGTYRRLTPEGEEPRRQAQWQFREVSRERMKKLGSATKKARADRLVPIAVVKESGATGATKSETQ